MTRSRIWTAVALVATLARAGLARRSQPQLISVGTDHSAPASEECQESAAALVEVAA